GHQLSERNPRVEPRLERERRAPPGHRPTDGVGVNQIRLGIGAVTRRLENGGLKVLAGRCPNLLGEAEMYRYTDNPREGDAETPVDEHNHALAALRYLICTIDEHELARPKINTPPAAA